jgi:VIT1/CCC1 family predicted Fe2+/Mn2+ transporter
MELVVAIVVAWIVLALVGALAGHVTQANVPFNATYSRPQ